MAEPDDPQEGFCSFLYDKETGEVLGRDCRSWSDILIYYVIYYACLASFFAGTVGIFASIQDVSSPRLTGADSWLEGNPGMGFHPVPDVLSTFIVASKGKRSEFVEDLTKFLKQYKEAVVSDYAQCDPSKVRLNATQACYFAFDELTRDCNEANGYGIYDGKPCILLQINRIFGWVPQVWSKDEVKDAGIPDAIKSKYEPDRIWVNCFGFSSADNDNLGKDDITYYPYQGFPLAFFPYEKQYRYLSPLVFVKFGKMVHNLALEIECQALAKNIEVDRDVKEGSVKFELFIDSL